MEELFQPQMPAAKVYPVIAVPVGNGFLLTAVDFSVSVCCNSMEQGLIEVKSQIQQLLMAAYPPIPTPCEEVMIPDGGFVVMVAV